MKFNKKTMKAINALNDGYVLEAYINGNRNLFVKFEDKIEIYSQSYALQLSKEKFAEMFGEEDFKLIDYSNKENSESKEKDEEYYSKLQKSQ